VTDSSESQLLLECPAARTRNRYVSNLILEILSWAYRSGRYVFGDVRIGPELIQASCGDARNLISRVRETCAGPPDQDHGKNRQYTMAGIGVAVFSRASTTEGVLSREFQAQRRSALLARRECGHDMDRGLSSPFIGGSA
jgi:hypothetical protein